MKEKLFKICQKLFVGGYIISFPKLAPIFTLAFIVSVLGRVNENSFITIIGHSLIVIAIFGFFFPRIFRNNE